MGGNSGRQAGPRRAWREGVFDGQEVSAPYAAHPQPGVQAAGCIVHEALAALLLHVLPSGLQRIRHYRLLVNRMRHAKLERCRELLGIAPPAPNGQEPDEDYRDRCLRLTGGHCGPTAFAGGSVQLDRSPTRREPAPSRRTAFARPRWPAKDSLLQQTDAQRPARTLDLAALQSQPMVQVERACRRRHQLRLGAERALQQPMGLGRAGGAGGAGGAGDAGDQVRRRLSSCPAPAAVRRTGTSRS